MNHEPKRSYFIHHCSTGEITTALTEPTRRWTAIRIDKNLEKAFEAFDLADGQTLETVEAMFASRGHLLPKPYTISNTGTMKYHDADKIRYDGMTDMACVFCKYSPNDEVARPVFADIMVR